MDFPLEATAKRVPRSQALLKHSRSQRAAPGEVTNEPSSELNTFKISEKC